MVVINLKIYKVKKESIDSYRGFYIFAAASHMTES